MEENINYIFNLILENPGIYLKKLIEISGKCSEIINRCVKYLVKIGKVTKTKWFGKGVPHRVCLSVIV